MSGIVMPGMLDMSCPAWGSAFGDALLPVVADISIPGMVPIPDMSWAAALGFAAGVARLAAVGLVAGLADVLRLAGVAGFAAGLFFAGALAAGMFMPGIFCMDCALAGTAKASGAALIRRRSDFMRLLPG
ncbi:hypothetical protein Q5H94_18285, partial [Sphingomonas sp. CA1-15]|nr:hypothetical protein [Sphingomonas sp. CA1-15]